MKRTVLALALSAASATTAAAQAIGPFTPDTTVEATIAAHPDFGWDARIGVDGSANALARKTLSFAGLDWEVAVSRYPGSRYALSLAVYEEVSAKEACFERLAGVVAALEPTYGPFGRHPAFARENNALYGFAFSLPGERPQPTFRLREVGGGSLAREWLAWTGLNTFAEVDPADGETVAVTAVFTDGERADGKALNLLSGCSLSVEAFQSDDRAGRIRSLDAPGS